MKQSDSYQKPGNRSGKGTDNKELNLSALKSTDYSSSFDEVSRWMYAVNNQKEFASERVIIKERKLQKMKRYFLTNKLRLVYPVIALALLIAACSMPVTQHENMGSAMSWTVDKSNPTVQNEISSLGWIDKSQLNTNENTNNGKTELLYTLVLPNATAGQIIDYQAQLEKIKGVTSVKVYPIGRDIKRPLYSAALNTFFRVNVDGTNLSDKELEEQVQKQFKDAGMENPPDIQFSTDANGHRMIKIKADEQLDKTNPKSFELNVKDGNKEEVLKSMVKHSSTDEFKGMTDEQIRNKVRQDTERPDLKDSEIQIIRENGEINVKLEVERQDGMMKRKEKQ